MTQFPLNLQSDPQRTALLFVESRPELFRADFKGWLADNWHVYVEFEKRSVRLWRAGRRHYGARSIWETMRYDTMIGELSGDYKLNDHYPPDCARLLMLIHADMDGFFEIRSGVGTQRAA